MYIRSAHVMIVVMFVLAGAVFSFAAEQGNAEAKTPIDRHALVTRHNVAVREFDALSPLTVGNGEFAYTVDATGLQTFPELYRTIPLGTQSQWGWHSFPLPEGKKIDDIEFNEFETLDGRKVTYLTKSKGQKEMYNWRRENPHRLHLGQIGFLLRTSKGQEAKPADIGDIKQVIDLWTGAITSEFIFDGQPVKVTTCCTGERDGIAVRVESPLVERGQIQVRFAFPYGSPSKTATDWKHPDRHTTEMNVSGDFARFERTLDDAKYYVGVTSFPTASWKKEKRHFYVMNPEGDSDVFAFVCEFGEEPVEKAWDDFEEARDAGAKLWEDFWNSGGAIDLSESTDPRADELERRIVLSEYQTRVNCAGSLPPQETGLVFNTWNGKFHLEMHWWHAAHFASWNRLPLLERSLHYYGDILPAARRKAKRQGYEGVRWPKMVGPEGWESPSGVGPYLIWQEPHPIYYAELCYRAHPNEETLKRFQAVVEQTAEFMASFPVYQEDRGEYVLGPPLNNVAETGNPMKVFNPTYELSYWRFGLETAQRWRQRLGMERDPKWDDVLQKLAPLPVKDGVYLAQENWPDTYTAHNHGHPSVVGIYGMLPGAGVDPETMRRTVQKTYETWKWSGSTWGWDFPLMAMAAARVGLPEMAVDTLLYDSPKNRYLKNGHNFQTDYLSIYLPGNGGLLSATAMMAAGWDGCPDRDAPGFPDDGRWVVKHEGLRKMP